VSTLVQSQGLRAVEVLASTDGGDDGSTVDIAIERAGEQWLSTSAASVWCSFVEVRVEGVEACVWWKMSRPQLVSNKIKSWF
jgi:hypothetical protein